MIIGILKRAAESSEETRGGTVQEQRDLWKLEQTSDQYTETQSTKSLSVLLQELGPNGQKLLSSEEIETINETGQVTIGSRTIVFKEILTIGSEYDKGNIEIGDEMTYKGTKDWIVFGKDKSGNVLLTTSSPVGSFTPTWKKEHWFTWEDELDAVCDDYAGTIQGRTISARSIRIEDINNVTGFTEPTGKKYRFGKTQDYANGKVNYYYPDNNTSTYIQATVDETTVAEDSSDVPAKDIECNAYYYQQSGDEYKFYHYEKDGTWTTETIDLTKNLKNVGNMKYVIGESGSYMQYYVASRSVNIGDGGASFHGAGVNNGCVNMFVGCICGTWSTLVYDAGGPAAWGVRPIVELPSDIQVKATGGTYDIK